MSKNPIQELRDGIAYVEACLRDIDAAAGDDPLDDDTSARFDEGVAYIEEARAKLAREEKRAAIMGEVRKGTLIAEPAEKPIEAPNVIRKGDPFDLSTVTRDNDSPKAVERDLVERARRVIGESEDFPSPEAQAEAERKVRSVRPERGYSVARHILRTSSPEYISGWLKAMSGREPFLDPAEREALEVADAEYRAASTTTTAGGFLLPTPIDQSVILTADVSVNPWRQISRVESVMNDNGWTGVTSAGITASWDTEGSEVSDDAPTFAQPNVPVYKAAAFVPFSIEIGDDWGGLAAEMAREFAEAKDSLEAAAFATGSGSNQPTGIVTALNGTASATAMATNSTFAVGDLFTAQQALQSRHQGNASWVMNLVHINDVREFGGTSYYTRSATLEADATGGRGAGKILGKPVYESSDLSSTLDGDTNNNIVYGNFRHYVIADRIGVRTEFIPHLFATGNNRPSGQRGLYMHWRVGADSVNDNAFVLLYNPST